MTCLVPDTVPSLLPKSFPVPPALKYAIPLTSVISELPLAVEGNTGPAEVRGIVPAVVPLLTHSTDIPLAPGRRKKSLSPTPVMSEKKEPTEPGVRSLTKTVPAVVPSLFQSSRPCTKLFAVKNRTPLTLVRLAGVEEVIPTPVNGLMSLTRTVPAVVPSVFHSSKPCTPSSAVKKRVLLTTSSSVIWNVLDALKVRTTCVPAPVPSLFHKST